MPSRFASSVGMELQYISDSDILEQERCLILFSFVVLLGRGRRGQRR